MKEESLKNDSSKLLNPKQRKKKHKFNFQAQLGKLSGAFMLPISLLAFAGIFLGIGSAINTHTSAETFGNFISQIGNSAFAILPLLFCVSIAIAFTNQAAIAGFTAVVAWMAFNALTSSLILPQYADPEVKNTITHYSLFGWSKNVAIYGNIDNSLMTGNQGFTSFNTSVFGAITVGAISAYVYNTFSNKQLPMVISFFSGQRLAPIMAIVFMIPLCFVFLFIWPLFGKGLYEFGSAIGKAPVALNSLFFGYFERALVPFGLHHVFYAPLWWTSAGGEMDPGKFALALGIKDLGANPSLAAFQNGVMNAGFARGSATYNTLTGEYNTFLKLFNNVNVQKPYGDVYMWFFFEQMPSHIEYLNSSGTLVNAPAFDFVYNTTGIRLGEYVQGKYPFMIFGLPAAAAAMVMAAPKKNRKMAASVCISAVASSFIAGITEPIEFTFLLLAPWLFWGVHAVFAAISFWMVTLFGAHLGMTFSGGIIDYIVYGLIPYSHGTHAWIVPVVGLVYAPLYFFVFYFLIKRFNVETPGRGSNTKFFTKKDYLEKKQAKKAGGVVGLGRRNQLLVAGLGGWGNISQYGNCANRLRYDIEDMSKVNEDMINEGGARGIIKAGKNHIQVILGSEADLINKQIMEAKGSKLDVDSKSDKTEKSVAKKETTIKLTKPLSVKSVAVGNLKAIEKLSDPMFAQKTLGDGIAIKPTEVEIYAPISGTLETVFPTKHAFGISNSQGVQLMIHAGIDTVKLNGKGFTTNVKQGQKVKQGDLLGTMDFKAIEKAGYEYDIIVILLNESKGKIKISKKTGKVTKTSQIFTVE